MADSPRIGIDLGGTKIEGVVTTGDAPHLQTLARRRIPTEQQHGCEHILARVAQLVQDLEAESGQRNCPVGVGMPGSVTTDGRVKNSNTVCLNNTPFRQQLSDRLERSIQFSNDANCFALAEAQLGAGRGHRLVFGVILGTGVGGGIVIDGRIHTGPQSIAGEWGHSVIDPHSPRACYCGLNGCVETYLSGPGIEAHYHSLSGENLALADIVARPEADPIRTECLTTWFDAFGRALASVINILDPDVVILGGGVSKVADLYTHGLERVAHYVFNNHLNTPILKHQLGDAAGVLGAALIADQKDHR